MRVNGENCLRIGLDPSDLKQVIEILRFPAAELGAWGGGKEGGLNRSFRSGLMGVETIKQMVRVRTFLRVKDFPELEKSD